MQKFDIKWAVAVVWESIPSSLQDTIRKWGWETVIGAICMMGFFAYSALNGTLGLPWEYRVGIGAVIFVCVAAGFHFVSLWWERRKNKKVPVPAATLKVPVPPAPLLLEFEGTNPVRWCNEMHRVFPLQQVSYKFYGVFICNSGTVDVEDVAVEVEKIEQIQDRPGELMPFPSLLNLRLRFKDGSTSKRFAPGFRERVPVISHSKSVAIDSEFRMESTQAHRFEHNNRRQKIYLRNV